ncbi:hypothetical protein ABB37_03647 [Leptomonas pyrrhocoris]|uniref:Centrosomal protein POC5 n=1 Tax=Leptomonas pyrrhocoris TaxID=157538 RepID=A0A0M9G329_LEPPY|nr:hypothetical protein ABB37_03647 [Leptomonas pyrrhocoris]KPA81227.1 hypothetical protein ABB37_03647 [Leptomonas pyrrhocoris]|eukprot:XP_015659666.1 hypothetical protein ABB37_03647 [Leptomonas pyrrhocoris]
MPLVSAENDESFVAEVADEVRATSTRMNEHVCAMLEEYLHRRLGQVRCEMQRECDRQIEHAREEIAAVQAEKAAEEKRHASAKKQLAEAAKALQQRGATAQLLACFVNWMRAVELHKERRRLAEEANRHQERSTTFQRYLQWRLFAAARRSAHLAAVELHERDCREQELQGQIDVYQKTLREEQENNETLNEKLKEAFVRGMCALNREAVQVLHGADDKQEDDVEAIAEILSRDSPSRRISIPQNKTEDTPHSNTHQHPSICPVHQVDRSGQFYHRCFAPGYCSYDDRRPRSRTPPSSSVSSAPPPPFVVRADPRAVRSFNATSSVPLRHAEKPPPSRWKL